MRNPSIHITQSDLEKVLEKLFKVESPGPFTYDTKEMALRITEECKKHSLPNRSISVTNAQMDKKVEKITKSSLGDTAMFQTLLFSIRTQLKHRGIVRMNEQHKDWPMLKQIAADAVNFWIESKLEKKEAFTTYIRLGINKMQTYSLNKFVNLYQPIVDAFFAKQEIQDDPSPHLTERGYNLYLRKVIDKTGMSINYKETPEKYVFFVRAKNEAIKVKATIEQYIEAQFHGLGWTKGIPDPLQLVGKNAIERYIKYAYAEDIKIPEKGGNINWAKIKRK